MYNENLYCLFKTIAIDPIQIDCNSRQISQMHKQKRSTQGYNIR